jgi:hypothetical protein
LRETLTQILRQCRVKLDGGDAVGVPEQLFGERTAAGADLYGEPDMVAAGGVRDALQSSAVNEKMLPELLTGQVSPLH